MRTPNSLDLIMLACHNQIITQCPICQTESNRLFQKENYWIRQCQFCQHQFLEKIINADHVATVYGDDYFNNGGAGYPGYLQEAALIRAHGRRYAKLLNKYMMPGRVLDVGSAAGFILQGFVQSGWKGVGIEPNDSMAAYGRKTLQLDIRTGAFEQITPEAQFDLVNMVQVIPHFWDLRQALTTAASVTKPGGYWLIETWNYDSCSAKLLGKNWHEYSPPSVLRWFSHQDLDLLAKQYGFYPIKRGRPQKWISGAHIKSLVGHKLNAMGWFKHFKIFLNIIPDNLRLPYPSEDLFWVLYQKADT